MTPGRRPCLDSRPCWLLHQRKKAGQSGRPRSSGWRGSHRPRQQSRISAYLVDGDVGCRATGAPTSSRARVEACGSRRMRTDLGPRHTGDRGASCATPSREVGLCRPSLDRSFARTPASPGPLSPWRARSAAVLLAAAQRLRMGPRQSRGNVSPRAASGGPIPARLAPGNSAVPAMRMPCSDADRDSPERTSRFRRALVCCWRCPWPPSLGAGAGSASSACGPALPDNVC